MEQLHNGCPECVPGPSQSNFTLATNATHFLNPSMTQFTYYNSTADEMLAYFGSSFNLTTLLWAPTHSPARGTWRQLPTRPTTPPSRPKTRSHSSLKSETIVSCSPNPVSNRLSRNLHRNRYWFQPDGERSLGARAAQRAHSLLPTCTLLKRNLFDHVQPTTTLATKRSRQATAETQTTRRAAAARS